MKMRPQEKPLGAALADALIVTLADTASAKADPTAISIRDRGTAKPQAAEIRRFFLFTIIAMFFLCVVGCKFKPPNDMEEQPNAHPPYKPSGLFTDGTTAR